MKILWSDSLNDYLYGKVVKKVNIKQFMNDNEEVYIVSKPVSDEDEPCKSSKGYNSYVEWDSQLGCYIGYGKCFGCVTQITQDLWMIEKPKPNTKDVKVFKEWLLDELLDNHFDVCAVNTEWFDWGRKIKITVSVNDLTTMHNHFTEVVNDCVEQYFGDVVNGYTLFLEL